VTENTMQTNYVGVRFSRVGKIYHFDASNIPDLKEGDSVVVETSRGWQLGQVAQMINTADSKIESGLKAVDRRATPRDLLLRQAWQRKEQDVLNVVKQRAAELKLQDVKVISAEYSFDGARLAILFSSESEDKVDLKSLRQDMQKAFTPSQVELRQIGPRDVAKILGGMGACGLESRCCSKFLSDFSSISIRMAKEQGISLTPSEITGMCGRLRCCLIYEYEQYAQARAILPKRNKRVQTPVGEGKVIDIMPLRDAVMVELLDNNYREFKREEIQVLEDGGDKDQKKPNAPESSAAGSAERPDRPKKGN
jgi:cell fate regulator YaaT (PSP1 superfamily)